MRDLIAELAAIAGPGNVLTDPGVLAGYATDWTRRYHGTAACVLRPGTTAEVAAAIRACAARGVPVVPQGGNTGLVGGSVPGPEPPAPVIVSMTRLDDLGPVDTAAGQVTAGAGVTIARLAAHAGRAGLRYGVDLASRDSATVGGTIATNAGGVATIRYGPTRSQLAGVTAVLADGSVVSDLSGLTAGGAGYDLAQLLTGSEGTLGVITAARLLLHPAEPASAVLLAGVDGIAEAAALCAGLRAALPGAGGLGGLLSAEYLDRAALDLVCLAAGLPPPLPAARPGYLLVEVTSAPGAAGAGFDPEPLSRAALPADTVVALDGPGRAALWAYRERLTESIATRGIPHKIDVAVPAGRLAAFAAGLADVVRGAAGARAGVGEPEVIVFGHIGVGNLHVNVLGPDPADTAVDAAVARLAAALGGSVAAEHGVGRAKAGWLGWTRSAAELAAMRAIKTALDPGGLLNPGVLLPAGGEWPAGGE